ncbi:unnamed protein product [Phytophthora fragariaefolia]|uniref:Unnamed protein product n=1 Tax=Phytophthora fragariaefolia TaxID=1490495 RepID=A0A9W7CV36_9STRA|nr:unnamed protein product [Phytophthora fragariaefolia]
MQDRDALVQDREIDRPPESSKGPDTSRSSDSELQEVETEIALHNVSDTTPPEIAGPDKREAVEEKEETDDNGTDDEVLSALSLSSLRVSEIDVQNLSALLTSVSEWLFPAIDPASHPHRDSYEDLITGATVDALMDTSPWSKLSNGEAPLTFIPAVSGRRLPPNFVQDYLILEERHLQSYWESTHFLPISEAMCSTDQALSTYHEQRRQRRSRAGAAWRRFLTKDTIPALRHRQCDLDILLGPFFLHFPKSRVTKHWFPKLDGGASSLAEAADILDLDEPWRLQFRQNPQYHPAMRIARLRDKFLDPRHVRPSASVVL